MGKRQPISQVINSDEVSLEQKQLLKKIVHIRNFASSDLRLPDNASYTTYVELERDYVTWAVFASDEFSLQAKTWCFWIVGCVPYRGYFDEAKAQQFASQLKQEGLEVYIASVPAYSTLGWFSDPILSSMLHQGEIAAAEYVFHELAHQQLYIKDDADFNEAFATAVGQLGIAAWLSQHSQPEQLNKYEDRVKLKEEIYQHVDRLRVKLETVYSSPLSIPEKTNNKKSAYAEFKHDVLAVLKKTNHHVAYEKWIFSNLNNAKLNALSTYQSLVPAFIQLFERCDRKFQAFYVAVEQLKKVSKSERAIALMNHQCQQKDNH